jgi:hypothetical protein
MSVEQDEQMLELVTDALRDGPGSPAWGRAISAVGVSGGDELALLARVHQRLQSGKRWRQVRPGIGFTRKVMDAVDQQADASVRATGPATVIAILCGALVLIVIAMLIPVLLSHAKPPATNSDELSNVYFSTPWVQSQFDNTIGGEWKAIGSLPIHAAQGVRLAKALGKLGGDWGIESVQSLPATQTFSFAITMDIPLDGVMAQVFITDQQGELAAVVDSDHVQVMLPGGQLAAAVPRGKNRQEQLRWLVGPKTAAMEIDGRRIWTGPNGLSADQPRFIGVRFVAHGNVGQDTAIQNIDVRTSSGK